MQIKFHICILLLLAALQSTAQEFLMTPTTSVPINTFMDTVTSNGVAFRFAPGLYFVGNPGVLVRPGWKIRGAGIDSTFIRLTNNAATNVSVTLFYADLADAAEVSDMTIDCNFQNQAVNPQLVNAISLTGSDIRIARVKAINWATKAVGRECFVIDISNDGATHYNDVIEDCVVTTPAPVIFGDGVSALSIFSNGGTQSENRGAVLRNNLVYGVVAGSGLSGSPVYFNAYQDSAGGMTVNNMAYDLTGPRAVGIYRDTFDGQDVVITGNLMDNVTRCIYYNMPVYHMKNVFIRNNVLRPSEGGIGIAYFMGGGKTANGYVDRLVIKDNAIYPSALATNCTPLQLDERMSAEISGNRLDYRISPRHL